MYSLCSQAADRPVIPIRCEHMKTLLMMKNQTWECSMDRIYKELCVERNHKARAAEESSVGGRVSRTQADGERRRQGDLPVQSNVGDPRIRQDCRMWFDKEGKLRDGTKWRKGWKNSLNQGKPQSQMKKVGHLVPDYQELWGSWAAEWLENASSEESWSGFRIQPKLKTPSADDTE